MVQFPRFGVALDLRLPGFRIEFVESGAEAGQFFKGQFLNSLFDLLNRHFRLLGPPK
jgi:hypothetical protein